MLKGVIPGQQKVSLLNKYVISSHDTFTREQRRNKLEFLYDILVENKKNIIKMLVKNEPFLFFLEFR